MRKWLAVLLLLCSAPLAATIEEASATDTATVTTTAYTLLDDMTISPAAGEYLAIFTSSAIFDGHGRGHGTEAAAPVRLGQ